MNKLLLATTNPGKINELKILLRDASQEIISLSDLDIDNQVKETGKTFEENAILKARYYADLTGLLTLADDSGLEIDYLNGEPGVLSRRWPGYEATDEELIQMALEKLHGVPAKKRGAQFKAVLALALPKNDKIFTFEGVLRGFITEEVKAPIIPGFPFRSIIFIPEIGRVLGELPSEEEALVSHRKKALERAKEILRKLA